MFEHCNTNLEKSARLTIPADCLAVMNEIRSYNSDPELYAIKSYQKLLKTVKEEDKGIGKRRKKA